MALRLAAVMEAVPSASSPSSAMRMTDIRFAFRDASRGLSIQNQRADEFNILQTTENGPQPLPQQGLSAKQQDTPSVATGLSRSSRHGSARPPSTVHLECTALNPSQSPIENKKR